MIEYLYYKFLLEDLPTTIKSSIYESCKMYRATKNWKHERD